MNKSRNFIPGPIIHLTRFSIIAIEMITIIFIDSVQNTLYRTSKIYQRVAGYSESSDSINKHNNTQSSVNGQRTRVVFQNSIYPYPCRARYNFGNIHFEIYKHNVFSNLIIPLTQTLPPRPHSTLCIFQNDIYTIINEKWLQFSKSKYR